jgi:hypothetical protein
MPNRKAKKKWANAHLFPTLFQTRPHSGQEKNHVPSDFMILAIFCDKGKRSSPVSAR